MVEHVDRIGQARLAALHDHLRQRPAQSAQKRRRDHHEEADQTELRRLVREHHQAARDHQHHGQDRPVLQRPITARVINSGPVHIRK